jgi:hypothetical protein
MKMAKAQRHALERRIAEAAQVFATEVVSLIGSLTLDDLGELSATGALPASARARRGSILTRSARSLTGSVAVAPKRRRSWPTCDIPGCTHRYYPASGRAHLCYEHFLESGGKHPSQRK